ncbi:proline-specific permease ProY [Candidatus Gillettellia adelgis]
MQQQSSLLISMKNKLNPDLSAKHIRFIAIGSAIGTGLFYGSADAIKTAGPSVLLAYVIGGIVAFIILRALGELLVNNPHASSFAHHAHDYLGSMAGYITGWTYCLEILIVSVADVTAFGIYMGFWFPDMPQWIWVFGVVLIVGATNLMSVKVFGELELWFSFFKISAIMIMIIAGIGMIVWGLGKNGQPTGIHNLWSNNGFFGNGVIGMILSLQLVMFSYGGIEIIGITASETQNPKQSIPKAINSMPWRILVFYIGTLLVIMSIYPWNQVGTNGSPFVSTLQNMGITISASILNIILLIASLSAINSDVFGVSRMLYSLAEHGHAPKICNKISKWGIPWVPLLMMMLMLFLAVYLNYVIPKHVFLTISALATFATVWVWIMILCSQIAFRCSLSKTQENNLAFPLWGGIFTSTVAILFLFFIIGLIGYQPTSRTSLYAGIIWMIILLLGYYCKTHYQKKSAMQE